MTINPPSQYADDRKLRARQRLWQHQRPYLDLAAWVVSVAGLGPGAIPAGTRVLDAGCGNGAILRALRAAWPEAAAAPRAVGLDLSAGMLAVVPSRPLVNADIAALPFARGQFGVVLAVHMLYHVPGREQAISELRRVLAPGGTCVAVTNGAGHLRGLWRLVAAAAREAAPGWRLRNPVDLAFSAENGAAQLGTMFSSVTCVRPEGAGPVVIRDAGVAADYVASVGDHYQAEVGRPWAEVVAAVRRDVQAVIDTEGAFRLHGDPVAFVCR